MLNKNYIKSNYETIRKYYLIRILKAKMFNMLLSIEKDMLEKLQY